MKKVAGPCRLRASCRGLELCYEDPMDGVFFLSLVETLAKSRHLGEVVEKEVCPGRLRALYLVEGTAVSVAESAYIFPEALLREGAAQPFCRRVLELGYNALVWPSVAEGSTSLDEASFWSVVDEIRAHGIQCIFADSRADVVWWQASASNCGADQLDVDSYLEDLQRAEATAGKLIYVLPWEAARQEDILDYLVDEAKKSTSLAFSAVRGEPWRDFAEDHPFWERLRQSPDDVNTPLLPVINAGLVRQGWGLWPTLSSDLLERFLPAMERHVFGGAIVFTPHVPCPGSLLGTNLWVAAQSLDSPFHPLTLVRTRFDARYGSGAYEQMRDLLWKVRLVQKEVSQLPTLPQETATESHRLLAESLLAQLRDLRARADSSLFPEQMIYFVRDAKRLVFAFLQKQQISLANVLIGDDMQEAFWTDVSAPSRGIGAGARVELLDSPNQGQEGSALREIYAASCTLHL